MWLLKASIGSKGVIGVMLGGISFTLNRFIGPDRLGLQSMTYHPPAPEGATQIGGSSNLSQSSSN
ncbi:hypothetical protein [Nostoc sp. FACHB-133]|uniref:hypothetical protein n=1 Tax=Nostoc sp. FACHB-133 TaxID=2692835 RepID=UPI001683EDDA|nr:hypothetical protein [Nostoc sp. FACHB-133]MBD2527642.1 hypothetical protein [Nostoc sp. FACHB-133]